MKRVFEASDIEAWANRNGAESELPHLVKQFILSTNDLESIREIYFGDKTLHGLDGFLDFSGDSPWIPSGKSVWELSVRQDARKKIKDDFENIKTKKLPDGFTDMETTYVAVIARKVDKISEFEEKLSSKKQFKKVIIIDADRIADWINNHISFRSWFNCYCLGRSSELVHISQFWDDWQKDTSIELSNEIVLAGRKDISEKTLVRIFHQVQLTNIETDSPDEAIAFVYSLIASIKNEKQRDSILSKLFIVKNEEQINDLKNTKEKLYIVLKPPLTQFAHRISNFGHCVFCALGNGSRFNESEIKLQRPGLGEFSEALIGMGVPEEKSKTDAKACGCSVSIWRIWNILERTDPGGSIPLWAKENKLAFSIIPILLGGWSDDRDEDLEIVRMLYGKEYSEFISEIHPIMVCDNPLLMHSGQAWFVTAPPVAFILGLRAITNRHLVALENICKKVFTEIEPDLEKSREERMASQLIGNTNKYSSWIRDGIAGTLLRISVFGQALERYGVIPDQLSPQSFVDRIVGGLDGLRNDWRLLASLRKELPVLAEAAPVPFLDALDSLLQGDPTKITPIFDEGTGFFTESLQCGLLWALETLAWSPDYIDRVTIILTKLAALDPGGTYSNRPINSLREIYLSWHPGTNAIIEHRLAAFDRVLEEDEDVGWELLTLLLDRTPQMSSQTNKPVWKDFGSNEGELVTNKIHFEAILHYLEKAFDLADMNPQRWKLLVDLYSEVDEKKQNAISDKLLIIANCDLSEEQRIQFWQILRNEVNRNLGFQDASWAIKKDKIEPLQSALEAFNPKSPIDRISWLFDSYDPSIPFDRKDTEKYVNQIYRMREKEVRNLFEKESGSGIIKLVNQVGLPGLVAHSLKNILTEIREYESLLLQSNAGSEKERAFACEFSAEAYKQFKKQWINLVIGVSEMQKWSFGDIANTLIRLPDELDVFKIIDDLNTDVSREYWKKRDGILRAHENEAVIYAAKKLNDYGRSIASLDAIDRSFDLFPPEFVLELLSNSINELNSDRPPDSIHNLRYLFENAFKWLYKHKDSFRVEIAQMEYAYIPILTRPFEKKQLVLHEMMNRDPEFFVKLICDIYRPESERGKQKKEFSKEEQNRAKLSFNILDAWSTPPGVDEKGNVDQESFKKWIEKARILAKENDRLGIADQEIGKILYHFPPDPEDKLWPHRAMREIIEELKSEDLEIGIVLECYNSRGVVSKTVYEGGAQERKKAEEWESKAKSLGYNWPRTQKMLKEKAAGWEHRAKKADERAEQDRFDDMK